MASRPRRSPGRCRVDPSQRRRAQYTSIRFAESLILEGVAASIGSVGDAYDNALAESTSVYSRPRLCRREARFTTGRFKTIADVEYATMAWIDWYNNRRLHSRSGLIPPEEFEAHYYARNVASQPARRHPMKTARNP